jgi:prolyl oligopeptidase
MLLLKANMCTFPLGSRVALALAVATGACGGSTRNVSPDHPSEPLPYAVETKPSVRVLGYPLPPGTAVDVGEPAPVPDRYQVLESDSPDVLDWVDREGTLARTSLARIPDRTSWFDRLLELRKSGRLLQAKETSRGLLLLMRGVDDEAPCLYLVTRDGARKRLLSSVTDGAKPQKLTSFYLSPKDEFIAVQYRIGGTDESRVDIFETSSKFVTPIDSVRDQLITYVEWTSERTFYYLWYPAAIKTADRRARAEIREHLLNRDAQKDAIVRSSSGDAEIAEIIYASADKKLLSLFRYRSASSTEIEVASRDNAMKWLRVPLAPTSLNTPLLAHGKLYILTNDSAPSLRLIRMSPKLVARDHWETVIPERADFVLEDVVVLSDSVVSLWRNGVTQEVVIHDLDGKTRKKVSLPMGTVDGLTGSELDKDAILFFETLTKPRSLLRIATSLGEAVPVFSTPFATPPKSEFTIDSREATSDDGTKIPYLTISSKTKSVTARPVLMEVYGGFGESLSLRFSPEVLAWLEHGGLVVYALVRGGGEFGPEWHKSGIGINKGKSVDDYLAIARKLIADKTTQEGYLVARGASNGALVAGAAVVRSPSTFSAAILTSPIADMVRFPLFANGAQWLSEYGDPSDSEQKMRILRFSPYHNIRPNQMYPAIIVSGGLHDDRTGAAHARKLVAALQSTGSLNPIFYRVEMGAGHAGSILSSDDAARHADTLSFAWNAVSLGSHFIDLFRDSNHATRDVK